MFSPKSLQIIVETLHDEKTSSFKKKKPTSTFKHLSQSCFDSECVRLLLSFLGLGIHFLIVLSPLAELMLVTRFYFFCG